METFNICRRSWHLIKIFTICYLASCEKRENWFLILSSFFSSSSSSPSSPSSSSSSRRRGERVPFLRHEVAFDADFANDLRGEEPNPRHSRQLGISRGLRRPDSLQLLRTGRQARHPALSTRHETVPQCLLSQGQTNSGVLPPAAVRIL